MKSFYKKYHGMLMDEPGESSINYKHNKAFLSLCRAMKAALKKELGLYHIEIDGWYVGHYSVSAFFKKQDNYVYMHYEFARGIPYNLNDSSVFGFLYRTAEHNKDFTGGRNHFCSWLDLPQCILSLFPKEEPITTCPVPVFVMQVETKTPAAKPKKAKRIASIDGQLQFSF